MYKNTIIIFKFFQLILIHTFFDIKFPLLKHDHDEMIYRQRLHYTALKSMQYMSSSLCSPF